MSPRKLDDRTRLLLGARVVNGVKFVVHKSDEEVMQQMVQEGLFTYSTTMFSEGYWWTPAGKRAAEAAWRRAPVKRFKTRYRNHPQVRISLNGRKEELCHVIEPNNPRNGRALWVRKPFRKWLVDHPNGQENVPFKSADEAIAWALEQVGKPRK